MKKFLLYFITFFMVFSLSGCHKENKAAEKALEDGKLALASEEYDKAENLFKLSVDEDSSNEEGQDFYKVTAKYKEIVSAVDSKDYDKAKSLIDDIKTYAKFDSIETGISKLEVQIKEAETKAAEEKKEEQPAPAKDDAPQVSAIEYNSYTNSRYGFSIDYPADLIADHPPTNGDGLKFMSADGTVSLTASGINNVLSETCDSLYNKDLENLSVTPSYKSKSDNSFTISWEENGLIYYSHTVVGECSINNFIIHYPVSEQSKYGQVVDRAYNSFSTPGISSFH